MIGFDEIIEIGRFLKTHGINGEIAFSPLYDLDLTALRCVVVEMDGLPVPFFVESTRNKGADTLIVKIEDIDNEKQAAALCHKKAYALRTDVDIDEDTDNDGFSAYDFEGYTVTDAATGKEIGAIEYIDDTTQNWLFMVKPSGDAEAGNLIAIPVADEFITGIDTGSRRLEVTLPEGLLEL